MRVNFVFGCQNRVNDDIFHARYDVLFDRKVVLGVLFVEVVLEDLEADRVACFVHAESRLFLDLQAVVGEMHHHALGVDIVFVTGSSQVALFKEVKVNLCRVVQHVHECPYSNVELPTLEQQGPLDILLHNPGRISWLLVDELHDIPDFGKQMDSSTLVQSSGLQDPGVVFTMLLRDVLVKSYAFANVQIGEALLEPHHLAAH